MTTMTAGALSATETRENGRGYTATQNGTAGREAQNGLNRRFTAKRAQAAKKIPCAIGCGRLVRPGTKTGMCRECWTEHRPRSERKSDPEHLAAFMASMLRSFANRAKNEDPELALAAMLSMDKQLHALINEVGAELTAAQGPARVAQALGVSTAAISKRWGGQ